MRLCDCDAPLRLISVSANGTGNRMVRLCPSCGTKTRTHEPYPHQLEKERLKRRQEADQERQRQEAEDESPGD